jgi:hypothetical protein
LTGEAIEKLVSIKGLLKDLFTINIAALAGDFKDLSKVPEMVKKVDSAVDEAMQLGSKGIQIIGENVAVDYINVVYAMRDIARHFDNIATRTKDMV